MKYGCTCTCLVFLFFFLSILFMLDNVARLHLTGSEQLAMFVTTVLCVLTV